MANRIGHRLMKRSVEMRRLGSSGWNRLILETARKTRPDLTFILNGECVMPESVRALHALHSRVFIFHADNPFPQYSSSRPENLPCAVESDCYFIWSRDLAGRLRQRGVRRVEYLPFAWDEDVFPHVEASNTPRHDLVFIGGWDPEREEVLEPLARRFDLKIWGPPYWGTRTRARSATRRSWQGHALTGQDAAHIIARARITLNVLRRQNLPDGTIMRTFEVPGVGGTSLSTRTPGAADIFPEGVAAAYFADTEECTERIEYLLGHPEERGNLARVAHEIVCRGHRYVDRARQIVDVYGQLA
jgi:spore maturation protein CgeB